jgi:hypothetical protein
MALMKHQYIDRLEKHLQQVIEGTFSGLFGKKIRAQDIALKLARAMQDGLNPAQDVGLHPIAPDQYTISIHPNIHTHLTENFPDLAHILAEHLQILATQAGYHLNRGLQVNLHANPKLSTGEFTVSATHAQQLHQSTIGMKRIESPLIKRPTNSRLTINQNRAIELKDDVINIGRHYENNIIIDDPSVSRFHIQLRLRFGTYTLFDLQSPYGTTVNNIRVEQHPLKSNDSIRIGQTQIVYTDDSTQEMGKTMPMIRDNQ